MAKRKKIGLALSSGGARGLAHIGVIKALEEHNIPIDYIAGTSIGAMIGGVYAFHKDINLIEKVFLETDLKRVIRMSSDVRLFSGGLLAGERVKEFIKKTLKGCDDFKDLQIHFTAVACDIKKGEEVDINSGLLIDAIRASVSFPGVLRPVEIDGKTLIDGGVVNPVPADVARRMGADIVIAVNLDEQKGILHQNKSAGNNIYSNLIGAFRLLQRSLARHSSSSADIIITPAVRHITWNEFRNAKYLIQAGRQAVLAEINSIKNLIFK
ncbi:esterase [Candidatus Kuenenbacteria bacterium CG11_big_fil_rev_8_21_14_0_20_37_9]|uniref:Esterase n=2 Tax=Candidatus Kueneniibacteriota TaxID=1752740 RepID=A0A2M6XSV0_9BACT|nr:MAG: hypothetical protein AUJ29_01955 [Candidatus Kuenenbacteria bacterium CG1_02_38_13]PIR05602.1 MAG: esterase [Candidatus Kuenenbacteria bacterium CG11_big_fil_rev_8_21_14_0_20_37_9]PIU10723.1 MAG: esterase [Candidatus Kuenenbacteria bacterium CG08_land_8_20_14_0_20_37_23]